MMSQRDHAIGAGLLTLALGVAAATLLVWADAVTAAVVVAVGFVPAFVASHWAAELLGAAWDRRRPP